MMTVRVNRCGFLLLLAASLLFIFYARSGGGDKKSQSQSQQESYHSGPEMLGKLSLRSLLSAAIDVAVRGGQEVVAVRRASGPLQETLKGKTKEGVKDSATQGDYNSHKIMYYGLRKAFPQVKVISEEHTEAPGDLGEIPKANSNPSGEELLLQGMEGDELLNAEDISIWIDPLDATKEYTENLVQYVTTMVGVAVKGKPILGVIHRPFSDVTHWAIVGHGNNLNLLNQRSNQKNSHLRLIVSRSHAGNVANFSQNVLGPDVSIISAAGAGYKVMEVLEGRADAYVHVTAIKKWDLCAGYALMEAVGGVMRTLDGEGIDFSGHTDPLNSKGLLAYLNDDPQILKLHGIKINE